MTVGGFFWIPFGSVGLFLVRFSPFLSLIVIFNMKFLLISEPFSDPLIGLKTEGTEQKVNFRSIPPALLNTWNYIVVLIVLLCCFNEWCMFLSFLIMLEALFRFSFSIYAFLFMSVSPSGFYARCFISLFMKTKWNRLIAITFPFAFFFLRFPLNWRMIKVLTKKVITIKINKGEIEKQSWQSSHTKPTALLHGKWVINFYETLSHVLSKTMSEMAT